MTDLKKYQHPFFEQYQKPMTVAALPTVVSSPDEAALKRASGKTPPTKVDFPDHLFIPQNAQSIDIRRVPLVVAATQETILNFRAPMGGVTRFIAYAIFSDGQDASMYEFIPKVNGRRILAYHGDPDNNYKINLGLAPDLGNDSLIQCQLALNPDDLLNWTLVNNSGFDTPMGVRMVGYVDFTQQRANERVGG